MFRFLCVKQDISLMFHGHVKLIIFTTQPVNALFHLFLPALRLSVPIYVTMTHTPLLKLETWSHL